MNTPELAPSFPADLPGEDFFFHLLRHFEILLPQEAAFWKEKALDWEAEIRKPGSKFNPRVCASPRDAWDLLLKHWEKGRWTAGAGNSRLGTWEIPPDDLPAPLGWSALVPLETLSAPELSRLTYVRRDVNQDFPVPTLPAAYRRETRTLSAVFRPGKDATAPWEAISLFPGLPGEPFPVPQLSPEDRLRAVAFWKVHALALGLS